MQDAGLIAGRYAQALSDAVKDDAGFERSRDELRRLAEVFGASAELRHALANPVVTADAKRRVMQSVAERLETGETTRRFIDVLARHERLMLLPEMAQAVAEVADRRLGVSEVEIRSAVPLEENMRARIRESLTAAAGGKVRVSERVDPELLGGVVARIGATVYDGSLKTRLEHLRSRLVSGPAGGTAN